MAIDVVLPRLNSYLCRFISKNYPNYLPNSLLIAQAFILKYQNHGKKCGISAINTHQVFKDFV